MSIKVSIVVPVYNVAQYVSRCIESLINQTLEDIEIIVVNDKSTDNSLEVLNNYRSDKRIRVINNERNLRTAQTRNIGLEQAHGEYVGFLDGDDYVDPDFYEKLYLLAKTNNADIAKGVTKMLNTDGTISFSNENSSIVEIGKYAFIGHFFNAIYKRDILVKYNVKFFIDLFCFQIQAVYFSNKIVCCNDTFYNYVRHLDSCDCDIFSLEKWQRLNIGHANFIYNWINTHDYDNDIKQLYLSHIQTLYFYGFNKLLKKDVCKACAILAQTMIENYHCGFRVDNPIKLRRKLFKINKRTNILDYLINIIKGTI